MKKLPCNECSRLRNWYNLIDGLCQDCYIKKHHRQEYRLYHEDKRQMGMSLPNISFILMILFALFMNVYQVSGAFGNLYNEQNNYTMTSNYNVDPAKNEYRGMVIYVRNSTRILAVEKFYNMTGTANNCSAQVLGIAPWDMATKSIKGGVSNISNYSFGDGLGNGRFANLTAVNITLQAGEFWLFGGWGWPESNDNSRYGATFAPQNAFQLQFYQSFARQSSTSHIPTFYNLSECIVSITSQDIFNAPAAALPYNYTIALMSRYQSDLTTTNGLGDGVRFNYNVYNISNMTLYFKTNTTSSDGYQFINGTKTATGWYTHNIPQYSTYGNVTISDNDVYSFFTSGLNPETVKFLNHDQSVTLSSPNQYYRHNFNNMTGIFKVLLFEIMANQSSGAGQFPEIYYCNSSYTTGNPTSSSNCGLAGTLSNKYNHSAGNSSHNILQLVVNNATSHVAGIKITPDSSVLVRGGSGANALTLYGTTEYSLLTRSQTTGNNGNSWNNLGYEIDSHIHFTSEDMTFYWKTAFVTTNGTNSTLSELFDKLDLLQVPPTFNHGFTINQDYINNTFTFSWSPCSALEYVAEYNVSIVNNAVNLLNGNISTNTSFTFDSSPYAGNYRMRVDCMDNLNLSAFGYSNNFTIDNSAPSLSNNLSASIWSLTTIILNPNETLRYANIILNWSTYSTAYNFSDINKTNIVIATLNNTFYWYEIQGRDNAGNYNSFLGNFTTGSIPPVDRTVSTNGIFSFTLDLSTTSGVLLLALIIGVYLALCGIAIISNVPMMDLLASMIGIALGASLLLVSFFVGIPIIFIAMIMAYRGFKIR